MGNAYVFLAEGFEEIEALTVVDLLRRAGINTVTVSVTNDNMVTGSHSIPVLADTVFSDADLTDGVITILPGGMPGAVNLKEHKGLAELLKKRAEIGLPIAAICASPAVVLGPLGILKDKEATCYPGMEDTLFCKEIIKDQKTVISGNVITSRGPSTAMDLALNIIEILSGKEKREQIAKGLLL